MPGAGSSPLALAPLAVGVKMPLPRRVHSDLVLPLNRARMAIARVHAEAAD